METGWIDLDNGATTRPAAEVVHAVASQMREGAGNPSSRHGPGIRARQALAAARERIAALLGVEPDEVVLTSGGSEANNLALRGAIAANFLRGGTSPTSPGARGKRRIVISAVEHPSVRATAEALARAGAALTIVPVDAGGRLDLGAFERALDGDDVAIASVILAQNETGHVQPIDEAGALCAARGVRLHTDAVQAAGLIPLRFGERPIDLATIAAHKMHGPAGIGALFVRRGIDLETQITGGSHEGGHRAGTESVALAAGFGVACDLAMKAIDEGAPARVAAMRDRLENRLLQAIPGCSRNGADAPRAPHIASLRFAGVDGAMLVDELSRARIATSSGAACASRSLEPSPALLALGLTARDAAGALRLSLSRETIGAEIDRASKEIEDAVRILRALSGAPAARDVARVDAPRTARA